MNKRSLENRLFLFAACRKFCRVIPAKETNAIYLHVLSSSVSSDFISAVRENVCRDFSLFFEVFEPNTFDFCFVFECFDDAGVIL